MVCVAPSLTLFVYFFFFNDTATTEIYTLSLHDALPICEHAGPDELDQLRSGVPYPRRGPEPIPHVVANFHRLLLRAQWVSDSVTSAAASSRECPTSVSAAYVPGWIRALAASARSRSSVPARACAYRSCMDRWKRASAAASAGSSPISSPSRW